MKTICDISKTKFNYFLEFGSMPIANNYSKIKRDQIKYNCTIGVSSKYKYLKNIYSPNKERLFTSKYPYNASLSSEFKLYLFSLAQEIDKQYNIGQKNKFIIEIGSCDGVFLEYFQKKNIKHLGIEPTKNNHRISKSKKISSINKFFDLELSKYIKKKYSQADIVFSSNVIAHIENINNTFKGVKNLLDDNGKFIFENIYVFDLLKNTSFDQLYDEHVYTLSVTAVNYLANHNNLNLYDVKHTTIQGGSMRYYLTPNKLTKKTKLLLTFLKKENESKRFSDYKMNLFYNKCQKIRDGLKSIINKKLGENKIIYGYGASAKATFLINYCNLDSEKIRFIFDSSSYKIGNYLPGTEIKVLKEQDILKYKFDYIILFSWNHSYEIKRKNKAVMKKNKAKWIVPFPKISINL